MKFILNSSSVNDWTPEANYRFRIPHFDARGYKRCRLESIFLDYDRVYNINPDNNVITYSLGNGQTQHVLTIPSGNYTELAIVEKINTFLGDMQTALALPTLGFHMTYYPDSDTCYVFSSVGMTFGFPKGNLAELLGFQTKTITVVANEAMESEVPLLWMQNNFNLIRIKELSPALTLCYDGNSWEYRGSEFYMHRSMDTCNRQVIDIDVRQVLHELNVSITGLNGRPIYCLDSVILILEFLHD